MARNIDQLRQRVLLGLYQRAKANGQEEGFLQRHPKFALALESGREMAQQAGVYDPEQENMIPDDKQFSTLVGIMDENGNIDPQASQEFNNQLAQQIQSGAYPNADNPLIQPLGPDSQIAQGAQQAAGQAVGPALGQLGMEERPQGQNWQDAEQAATEGVAQALQEPELPWAADRPWASMGQKPGGTQAAGIGGGLEGMDAAIRRKYAEYQAAEEEKKKAEEAAASSGQPKGMM